MESITQRNKKSRSRNRYEQGIHVKKDIKFKTIDGRIYRLEEVHQHKIDAVKSAKLWRKMGNPARIFEEDRFAQKDGGGFYHGRYGVYVHFGWMSEMP